MVLRCSSSEKQPSLLRSTERTSLESPEAWSQDQIAVLTLSTGQHVVRLQVANSSPRPLCVQKALPSSTLGNDWSRLLPLLVCRVAHDTALLLWQREIEGGTGHHQGLHLEGRMSVQNRLDGCCPHLAVVDGGVSLLI